METTILGLYRAIQGYYIVVLRQEHHKEKVGKGVHIHHHGYLMFWLYGPAR